MIRWIHVYFLRISVNWIANKLVQDLNRCLFLAVTVTRIAPPPRASIDLSFDNVDKEPTVLHANKINRFSLMIVEANNNVDSVSTLSQLLPIDTSIDQSTHRDIHNLSPTLQLTYIYIYISVYWLPYSSQTSHHPSETLSLPWISYTTQKLMLNSCMMVEKQSEAFQTFLFHFSKFNTECFCISFF